LDSANKKYIIGVMSGSSLDGLDLALCSFEYAQNNKYQYDIISSDCIPLAEELITRFRSAKDMTAIELCTLDVDFGRFIGEKILDFITQNKITFPLDLISSHGHTLFHHPDKGFTTQIGDGAHILHITQISTLSNLRQMDVAHGGQGAPLVPIGDKYLFNEYKFCLNLGGICNISVKENNKIIAYDIGAFNQVLNHYANLKNLPYDDGGKIASTGSIDNTAIYMLSTLDFYHKKYPKSLDNGFSKSEIIPILDASKLSIEDYLCSFVEHISDEIARQINQFNPIKEDKILITGGGAYNTYFIERLQSKTSVEIVIPDATLINNKEALIMAFMGYLFIEGKNNVLSSVTGASRDVRSGVYNSYR
jgi:anhydro-N-acetylmuramic acid kinase